MARKVRKEPERKLSTVAWFGIGCGAALLLGLIALGVLWALATSGAPLPPEATARSTAPPPAQGSPTPAPAQAPPLRQQIDWVEKTASSPDPVPARVTIRQDELNDLIRQENPEGVQNLRVYFGDGTIAGTGDVPWRGQNLSLTVRARPIVTGGELDVQVLEVRVGKLAAPAAIHQEVHRELQRSLRRLSSQQKVRVQSVDVRPDAIIVSGQVGGR